MSERVWDVVWAVAGDAVARRIGGILTVVWGVVCGWVGGVRLVMVMVVSGEICVRNARFRVLNELDPARMLEAMTSELYGYNVSQFS